MVKRRINLLQVFVVLMHEMRNQFVSYTYWSIIVWPLLIMAIFERFENFKMNTISLSTSEICRLWGNILPIFIFMVCLSYVSIIANSVAMDKTSKLSELLMVMVDAKEQLVGKILSIYGLLIFQIAVYIGVFNLYGGLTGSRFLNELLSQTPSQLLVYVVLDAIVAILISLIWTTEIASNISDEAQVATAVIPVMLIIGTGTIIAMFFNSPEYFDSGLSAIRVYINVILAFPPIGSLLFPTLLAEGNVTYWEAFLNLGLELFIMAFIFRTSVRQYRRGMLSREYSNPFYQALEKGNTEKK
ncbi:ABC transporter permease [Levilactobacillus parabrevis]|uniref:ABC transporter permease n=1 Tax=Levilactobacillus parabrevis TaxID=357278 RepID=UPI0021A72BB2|nr:ABC transporter permease [Levilactobacillus parabrevis]MCT4487840.1 hypothetical protein [Levilactobacillus parabrevis]MCT4491475.1 hypothetical protein [Levilactobacillus parabrevis]